MKQSSGLTNQEISKLLDINTIIKDYIGKKPQGPSQHTRQPVLPSSNNAKPLLVFDLNLNKHQTIQTSKVASLKPTPNRNRQLRYATLNTKEQQKLNASTRQSKSQSHPALTNKTPAQTLKRNRQNTGRVGVTEGLASSIEVRGGRPRNITSTDKTGEQQPQTTSINCKTESVNPPATRTNQRQRTHQSSIQKCTLKLRPSRAQSCLYRAKRPNTFLKNRYELKNVIGKGQFSTVYKAADILTNADVAIKVSIPGLHKTPQEPMAEAKIFRYLDHPNIVKLLNSFVVETSEYLVLQYIPYTLSSYVSKNSLEIQQIKLIFKQLCLAVNHLHQRNMIHRDIKLENVLMQVGGAADQVVVKLIDFGLAIREQSGGSDNPGTVSLRKQFCGTPNYLAPEIIAGNGYYGKPADCWALGIVLYYLLHGRMPFKAKEEPELFRKIQKGKVCFDGRTDEESKRLINRLLTIQVSERFTVSQVLSDVWLRDVIV